MVKSTWKQCRDYTLRHCPSWVSGGGRSSAILYSGKFGELHPLTFDPHKITMRLILEDCYELKAQGLKYGSLNRYISAVSKVLKFSQEMQLLSQDWQVPRFKRFSEDEDCQERNAFTADELRDMVTFARDSLMHDALADIILFAALTGIRQEKILTLTKDKVDLTNKIITIMKPKKRGQKARTCGIHNSLIPMLVRRCKENRTYLFGDDWLNADQLRRHFRKCLRHINRTDGTYTFHGLRHTNGTLLIQSGVNIKDVADHMGHSSTRVTERYLHAADKNLAERVNSIDFAIA